MPSSKSPHLLTKICIAILVTCSLYYFDIPEAILDWILRLLRDGMRTVIRQKEIKIGICLVMAILIVQTIIGAVLGHLIEKVISSKKKHS